MSALLDVRDLTVDIPLSEGTLHPVRGISFSIQRGETLCLVGESGCGKSLTSLAIMGLLPKRATRTASALRIGDLDISTASPNEMSHVRGNGMAMIFQEPMTSLNPLYTIGKQIAEAISLHQGLSKQDSLAKAAEMLPAMRAVFAGADIVTERLASVPGLMPESPSPAAELVHRLTGRNATTTVSYASEGGQFQEAGLSTVICGPGSILQAHQPNEFIDLKQIDECNAFIGKLMDWAEN